jgi:integrase
MNAQNSFRISPHLDSYQRQGDKFSQFYIRVLIGSKYCYIKSGIWMHQDFWIKKEVKKVKGNSEGEKVEDDLRDALSKMRNLIRDLIADNQQITESLLRERWQSPEVADTLVAFAQSMVEREKESAAKGTTTRNLTYISGIREFDPKISLKGITTQWLNRYLAFRKGKGGSPNSLRNDFAYLAKVINHAIDEGKLHHSPLRNFKRPKYQKPDRAFLEPHEIDRLRIAFLNNEMEGVSYKGKNRVYSPGMKGTYQSILRSMLVSIYTGLRYSDVGQLTTPKGLKPKCGYDFDRTHLVVRMKKTGSSVRLKITDRMREVLDFTGEGPILPVRYYNNSHVNKMLRVITGIVGITKDIHFHTLRHTFTSELSRRGVRPEHLQHLLGHRDLKTTMMYTHIHSNELDAAMDTMDNNQSPEETLKELLRKVNEVAKENPNMVLTAGLNEEITNLKNTMQPKGNFRIAE